MSFLADMVANGTAEQAGRVMNALLQMKKLDIAALEKAQKGELQPEMAEGK